MVHRLSCIRYIIVAAMIAGPFSGCKKHRNSVSARHQPDSQGSAAKLSEDVNDIFFANPCPGGVFRNQLPRENKGDFLEKSRDLQLHGMPVYEMDPALIPPREFKIEEPQKYL